MSNFFPHADPNAPAEHPNPDEVADGDIAPSFEAVRALFGVFRVSWSLDVMLALKNTSRAAPLRRHELNGRLSAASERAITNALESLRSAGLVNREPVREGIGTHYFLSGEGRQLLPLLEEVGAICRRFAPHLAQAASKRKAPAVTEST